MTDTKRVTTRSAANERAQVTLDSIGDGVGCTDLDGTITFLNGVAEGLTGWTLDDAMGRPMSEVIRIVDETTHEPIDDLTDRAVGADAPIHLPPNSVLLTRDGREIAIEDSTAPIHDDVGNAIGAVIVFRDVSAARALSVEIFHSAQHDFLTGLPNRMLLEDRIKQAISTAPRHTGQLAILFLDLDGFKQINDSLGHPVGDRVLQAIAARLVECVRSSDTVSRQGGDEFVVLLSEAAASADAAVIAERMLVAVAGIDAIDGHPLHLTISVGAAVYPQDGRDASALIKNADAAMYDVKANGRAGYRRYRAAMTPAGGHAPRERVD